MLVVEAYCVCDGGHDTGVQDWWRMKTVLTLGAAPESDLEGAARIGDRIYWVTSHGRDGKGRAVRNRQRFFATTVTVDGDVVTWQPVGTPYHDLLRDLRSDSRLGVFGIEAASRLAPKLPGAGLALLVPLLNPAQVVSRLYEWAGPGAEARLIEGVNFTGSNPEGVAFEAANGPISRVPAGP